MTPSVRRCGSMPSRWDPFRDFEDLYQRMGRLMESTLGARTGAGWSALADASESDDAYLVEVELPSVRRDDVVIDVVGDELVIIGEFKERARTGLRRTPTRRTGGFEYRTTLPRDVDAENITAELTEGVFPVRVPKTEGARPRRIAITGG